MWIARLVLGSQAPARLGVCNCCMFGCLLQLIVAGQRHCLVPRMKHENASANTDSGSCERAWRTAAARPAETADFCVSREPGSPTLFASAGSGWSTSSGNQSLVFCIRGAWPGQIRVTNQPLRLPALMDLYIHPLYVLISKILSSILNSFALIHPLSILSTVGLTCHFI
jgi:hypothetical protein